MRHSPISSIDVKLKSAHLQLPRETGSIAEGAPELRARLYSSIPDLSIYAVIFWPIDAAAHFFCAAAFMCMIVPFSSVRISGRLSFKSLYILSLSLVLQLHYFEFE